MSLGKCKLYARSMTQSRIQAIGNLLGFSAGHLPFNYLGVPIFTGMPMSIHLQPIADKIKAKLAAWKGSLLSLMGRVQLIKSIIHGMLVYSFHVYAWPNSFLKTIDRWIRNFIWSGDILTKKFMHCGMEEAVLQL